MITTRFVGAAVAALLAALLVGCQQPQVDMSEMMKPPPRPAELDKLDMFVGRWEGTSEMTMPGSDKVTTWKGVDTASWDCDKRVLVEHVESTTSDGDKYISVGVWTWDPRGKKYRIWGFDNHGMTGTGTATYDEATKTWHVKGRDRDPATGQTMYSEGTMKTPDANTMEWNWTAWKCAWKCGKIMEMKGTSRRK